MTANRRAAIAVAALGVYLQAVEWLDLFPWNDIRHGNGQATLDLAMAAATLGLVSTLWISRGPWPAWLAVAALVVWGGLQALTWWPSYVFGASPGWRRVYARWFADTVQALPGDSAHLPPDANHLVLQLLILAALGASLAAAWPRRADGRA